MTEHQFDVQSLYGAGAEGNWHRLIYREGSAPFEPLTPALHTEPNLIQLCGTPDALHARFYQKGQPVQRCGSANIAIAEAARHLFGVSAAGGWPLHTRAATLWVGYDQQGSYYHDQPLRQRPLPKNHLWRQVLASNYDTGSYVGGDTDYCLLALARPVQEVQPALERLCRHSRRALILLHYDQCAGQGAGVAQLRYFAPQYGIAEDAATGSATVQAAHFCWQHYGETHMTFVQQSGPGGYIQTETSGDQVRVRAQARLSTAIQ